MMTNGVVEQSHGNLFEKNIRKFFTEKGENNYIRNYVGDKE